MSISFNAYMLLLKPLLKTQAKQTLSLVDRKNVFLSLSF